MCIVEWTNQGVHAKQVSSNVCVAFLKKSQIKRYKGDYDYVC